MKILLTSLALGAGLAVAAPALATDAPATGKPTQLAQQASSKTKRADKRAKADAKKADTKAKTAAKGKPQ
ncbi:MAG: hypothetical protein JO128_15855 [Alphaproteobacteria bacterium]|nr:hypothetical protein [Alphaproteobacteria bacterium]